MTDRPTTDRKSASAAHPGGGRRDDATRQDAARDTPQSCPHAAGPLGGIESNIVRAGQLSAYGSGQFLPPQILVDGGTLLFGESADAGNGAIDINSGQAQFMHQASAGRAWLHVGPDGGLGFEEGAQARQARIRNDGIMRLTEIEGGTLRVGSLWGTGTVHLGKAVLEVGALEEYDPYSGSLSDGCAGGGVRKVGAGTLTLSGTCLYRGETWVDGGCLRVDGSLHGSPVFVGAGARLAGGGAVSKHCVLEPGGKLAPASGGRAMQLGRLYARQGSVLSFSLSPDGVGDRVDVGVLSLEGALLDLSGLVPAPRTVLIAYARLEARNLVLGKLPASLRREDVELEFGDHALTLVVREAASRYR